jgi:hypothetical protein
VEKAFGSSNKVKGGKMKYWEEKKNKISLKDTDEEYWTRIFSIKKENEEIRFREECASYFFVQMKKQEAIDALQEAIDWIKDEK